MDQPGILIILAAVLLIAGGYWYIRRRVQGNVVMSDPWAEHRHRQAERQDENARPYNAGALAATLTQVSVLRFHFAYRDEAYAAVYLLPGHPALPPSNTDRFDLFKRYWELHAGAIWSWRGDNITDRLTGAALVVASQAREQAMLDILTDAGWQVTGRDAQSADLKVTHLSR